MLLLDERSEGDNEEIDRETHSSANQCSDGICKLQLETKAHSEYESTNLCDFCSLKI